MLSSPAAMSRSITCGTGKPRQAREMNDLRRRERVQAKGRKALLDGAKEILVPLERQIRIVPTLQQQLNAAERDRLVDLAEDLLEAEHVSFGRPDRPIERAEVAARDADVRVVDVAIDDVGDESVGMLAGADLVGELSEQRASARADTTLAPRPGRAGRRCEPLAAKPSIIVSDCYSSCIDHLNELTAFPRRAR